MTGCIGHEWVSKRMEHPCPFCGNAFTFMTVEMQFNVFERNADDYIVHPIIATVVCHGCGASVHGVCHLRDMAVG